MKLQQNISITDTITSARENSVITSARDDSVMINNIPYNKSFNGLNKNIGNLKLKTKN